MKFLGLISLLLLFTIISADDVCDKVVDCYAKAAKKIKDDILNERESLRVLLNNERGDVNKAIELIEKNSAKVAADIDIVNKKAAEIEKKAQEVSSRSEYIKSQSSALHNLLNQYQDIKNSKYFRLYGDAIVYENIYEAFDKKVWSKFGNPNGYDETSFKTGTFWGKRLLRVGGGENVDGININVPQGYDTLWFACPNHVHGAFSFSSEGKVLGTYVCGYRNINEISPDGTIGSNTMLEDLSGRQVWTPVNLNNITGGVYKMSTKNPSDGWINGIGFSKNIWGHARLSARAYIFAQNYGLGTNIRSGIENIDWFRDVLAIFDGQSSKIKVPVVSNGKDKILYIVEHNNNWVGVQHDWVKVNGKSIPRLRTSYSNIWATHFNSKFYMRYVATTIPKELIKDGDRWLELEINMQSQDKPFYFREIGTHDTD